MIDFSSNIMSYVFKYNVIKKKGLERHVFALDLLSWQAVFNLVEYNFMVSQVNVCMTCLLYAK